MSDLTVAHKASLKKYSRFELIYINSSGRNDFNYINVQGFLVEHGYYIYRTSVSKHIYIRMIDNIVREVGTKDITDEILKEAKKEYHRSEYEFALKNIKRVTNEDYLKTLPALEVEFKKDQKDAFQLYFQNCFIKITTSKTTAFEYSELKGCIWESQIIQRIFDKDADEGSDFKTFCWNISAKNKDRFLSLCSSLGYVIHNYKSLLHSPAIILNDEVISDNPEGGTGKGIIFKAISCFIKILTIDGKTFNFDKSFLYQRVTPDTRCIVFQDVKKGFNFERLFSVLTEGIVTERKGKDELFIDFKDSPKVAITTNYALPGMGNSHRRRRHELEISQHYHEGYTPEDDFNKILFEEWNEKEWSEFDMFIIGCCRLYLKQGLIKQDLINLPLKQIIAETCTDFVDFMADFDFKTVVKSDLIASFTNEYEEYPRHKWFTKQKFSSWVSAYSNYKGYTVEDYNSGLQRFYKFTALQTLSAET